jgi:ubiquinone biosynthesis protein UbiJ
MNILETELADNARQIAAVERLVEALLQRINVLEVQIRDLQLQLQSMRNEA